VRVLLVSTYDLGRQPFGLASAAAALEAAGATTACVDVSRDPLRDEAVRAADLVAFFLPMHTATRLAIPVIDRVRTLNPAATLCAYGLYAPLNEAILRKHGVTEIVGGEFEDALSALASRAGHVSTSHVSTSHVSTSHVARRTSHVPARRTSHVARVPVPHVHFRLPLRDALPPLRRYASLQRGAERRTVGYTEASRGCKHRCRHCPIVPVYDGRFRVVPVDLVLEDVRQQVAAGAQHITFGDPDFFNGPRHAIEIVRRLAAEFPAVSYDVTIKIEHLLTHADLLPLLSETGCAFVISAVESVDDEVLVRLDKGHDAAGFERAVQLCRTAGLLISPTFVAFTPWTTVESYCTLLRTIDRLELVDHVASIQLAIRLLIPEGSRLLELDEIRALVTPFDERSLTYRWSHRDPAVDRLQESIAALVGRRLNAPRRELFDEIWRLAHEAAGLAPGARRDQDVLPRAAVPYLNEPWYC
jgi:radical SAM superfamily enzyme YgiQ (UPF0313 family)